MPTRRALLGTLSVLGFTGCSLPSRGGDAPASPPRGTATPPPGTRYWYTHPRPTGNRTLPGVGDVRDADAVTFEPAGQPQWLVAHPADAGSHWTVVSADGRASRWRVGGGEAVRVGRYERLPARTQPVVATDGDERWTDSGGDGTTASDGAPRLLRPPGDMAERTSPMVAPAEDGSPVLLYVAVDGDLVVAGTERTRLDVDGLPDGRLAALGDGRYALFADPSGRYTHGALGDTTEGVTLAVVDPRRATVDWRATVGPPAVFEGLQPLVADLNGDGAPEIVATVADASDGARIAVFSGDGERIATGPVYGPGWRHQLAVAPFGPDGRPELAVVRKPHVDHVLEFYRLESGTLDIEATVEGFSTHTYGSRILDGAVAADLDADGRVEALVPTADRDALEAVRRSAGGADAVWRKSPDGAVRTNVTGVSLPDAIAVGAGTDETVTVWQG
ncbi:MAG: FG-GAP repeat domain-containing protein [Haloarculaceae archaeon]